MKKIGLDPGHGGQDSGAAAGGQQEKFITWDIVNRIKKHLETAYQVDVTIIQPSTWKVSDSRDELYDPPAIANLLKVDYYLSIHVNAGGGEGFESFVKWAARGMAADRIRAVVHDQVMDFLGKWGVRDRGKKYEDYAVLTHTDMPAALLELLFIDNTRDRELLGDEYFRAGLSNEIAYGLGVALELERRVA